MAHMKRRSTSPAMWQSYPLAAKFTGLLLVGLMVRVLAAQAPGASDTLLREETDVLGYKYQVPHESLSKGAKGKQNEIRVRSTVRQILNGQLSLNEPANKLQFRSYFQQYLFPLMTTEEGLKSIAKDRQDFFRDVQNAKNPDAHREIVDLTLASMMKIVQDNYRPAARYNAMLIISSLNDQEANNIGVPQTLPEPMRAALPFILLQFQKPETPDAIRLAALLGLGRHLEWENYKEPPSTMMPAAQRAEVIKSLTALAESKQPPPGRQPEAHNWLRRRAIEALSLGSLKKADPDIAATMDKLLKDESEPLSVRCTVASAFGQDGIAGGQNRRRRDRERARLYGSSGM